MKDCIIDTSVVMGYKDHEVIQQEVAKLVNIISTISTDRCSIPFSCS
jgi:hypothetical protein